MLSLRFHFQYFPEAADIAELRDQVERARLQLCDALDGRVQIGKVTLSVGQASEGLGDVWVFSKSGRSYTTDLLSGHVELFRDSSPATYTGATIAHELGHHLFGLGDAYREDIRRWDQCGQGSNFEPDGEIAMSPADTTLMQNMDTLCLLPDGKSPGDFDPHWSVVCAGTGCLPCAACAGVPNPPADVTLSCPAVQPLSSELTVAANFDKEAGSDLAVCPAPVAGSHLAVVASLWTSAPQNTSGKPTPSCGNGVVELDLGEQCEPSQDPATLPLCTDFGLAPNGGDRVTCNGNCTFSKLGGRCTVPVSATPCALTEGLAGACDTSGPLPSGATCQTFGLAPGGSVSCDRCSLNLAACPAPTGTCGNGVIEGAEQCDTGGVTDVPALDVNGMPVACSDFYGPLAAGDARCFTNCTFNKAPCDLSCAATQGFPEACSVVDGIVVPPVGCDALPTAAQSKFAAGDMQCVGCSLNPLACGPGFSAATWEEATRTSDVPSDWLAAVDGSGDVRLFRLYANPIGAQRWTVDAVGQGEAYAGGTPGTPEHLRSFELRFDPTTHTVIDVISGSASGAGVSCSIGGGACATGTMTLGGTAPDGTGEGSPAFAPGISGIPAGPLTLSVDFSGANNAAWLRYSDQPGTPQGLSRFQSGTVVSAGSNGASQVAACQDETACELWNNVSMRWEGIRARWEQKNRTTIGELLDPNLGPVSDWELLQKTIPFYYGSLLTPPSAPLSPEIPPPTLDPAGAECGGPLQWVEEPVVQLAPDAIVLVLDRSDSMRTPIDADASYGAGTGETRLAFAKAAARAFVDLTAARAGTPPRLGMVSFSTTATNPPDQAISELIPSGTPGAGQVTIGGFKNVIDGLAFSQSTAIGLGLDSAHQMLKATTFMARTVILLSDGENNQPQPVGQFEPELVAGRMVDEDNIRVFTVPTGRAADRALLARVANRTGGSMLESPISDELPPLFAEAFALANGESLIFPRDTVSVNATEVCSSEEIPNCTGTARVETPFGCMCVPSGQPIEMATRNLVVEEGAEQLNVVLSVRNTNVDSWHPRFHLVDPSGAVRLTETSAGVTSDRFYRILTIPNPEAGVWLLELDRGEKSGRPRRQRGNHRAPDGNIPHEARVCSVSSPRPTEKTEPRCAKPYTNRHRWFQRASSTATPRS